MTIVLVEIAGGGVGESVLNRGWIWDSSSDEPIGRDAGMNVRLVYVDVDVAVAGRSCRDVHDAAVCGRSSIIGDDSLLGAGKGPFRAFAGLAGLLPGIVSNVVPLLGTTGVIASLNFISTWDVSQESKPSEWRVAADLSDTTLESLDIDALADSSLVLEVLGRTTF